MSLLDEREKSFENKFAHDEEINFRIVAKTRKLIGLWAAEKMGKTPEESSEYARSLVLFGVDGGSGSVRQKILEDLLSSGQTFKDEDISKQYNMAHEEAHRQIIDGTTND